MFETQIIKKHTFSRAPYAVACSNFYLMKLDTCIPFIQHFLRQTINIFEVIQSCSFVFFEMVFFDILLVFQTKSFVSLLYSMRINLLKNSELYKKLFQMRQTTISFAQKRSLNTATPISVNSIRSKRAQAKEQKSISDIFNEVRQKIYEMQSSFKQERTLRQRQMLKTYIKILQKIGEQVMHSKQRYLNLDKDNLKTDKRLQIVTELNKERQQSKSMFENIKSIKQQIRKYEDENNYLEQQVEALQSIKKRKHSIQVSEKIMYKTSKKRIRSLQRKIAPELAENSKSLFVKQRSVDFSNTLVSKNCEKSFYVKDLDPQLSGQSDLKKQRQSGGQNQVNSYIGNKRRKHKYLNPPLHQNTQLMQFD